MKLPDLPESGTPTPKIWWGLVCVTHSKSLFPPRFFLLYPERREHGFIFLTKRLVIRPLSHFVKIRKTRSPRMLTVAVILWGFHFHTVDPAKNILSSIQRPWTLSLNPAREALLCEMAPKPQTSLRSMGSSRLLLPIRRKGHTCSQSKMGPLQNKSISRPHGGARKPVSAKHRPGLEDRYPTAHMLLFCASGPEPRFLLFVFSNVPVPISLCIGLAKSQRCWRKVCAQRQGSCR